MDWEYYNKHINRKTKGRCDVTPIFANYGVFDNLLNDLIEGFSDYDKIVGLDALGFVVGSALAHKVGKGFIPMRKKDKLPCEKISIGFVDYTGNQKGFELSLHSIKENEKILIVDEWIETGAQMRAAIELIEQLKGEVVGISVLTAHKNDGTRILFNEYNLKAINIVED